MLRTLRHWLINPRILVVAVFLGILSQSALAVVEKHDSWTNYLVFPPLATRSEQYPSLSFPAKENFLVANGNVGKAANIMSGKGRIFPAYSGNAITAYDQLHSIIRDYDGGLLYLIDTLSDLDTRSLELQIGEAMLCSPSFNSYKSPEVRLYSTSVDWKDPQYPDPVKFVLSVYRKRTITPRQNIPSAMVIMYTNNSSTKERTIIGYGRYGIYGTLTLLWEDIDGFPGTSFLQFGAAYDSPSQFQPFYDPDLKELTYYHQGQWIAAGWRNSDLSSLKRVTKYIYYMLFGS